MFRTTLLTATASAIVATSAAAQTELTWWHAMGGQLGETVNSAAEQFNDSQADSMKHTRKTAAPIAHNRLDCRLSA